MSADSSIPGKKTVERLFERLFEQLLDIAPNGGVRLFLKFVSFSLEWLGD